MCYWLSMPHCLLAYPNNNSLSKSINLSLSYPVKSTSYNIHITYLCLITARAWREDRQNFISYTGEYSSSHLLHIICKKIHVNVKSSFIQAWLYDISILFSWQLCNSVLFLFLSYSFAIFPVLFFFFKFPVYPQLVFPMTYHTGPILLALSSFAKVNL